MFHVVSGSPALSNAEGVRNFGEGRFLGRADLNAANAEQAAALARGFGGTLADLTKPALEGCSIAMGLCRQHRRNLAYSFHPFCLDVCRLAVRELAFVTVARSAPCLTRPDVVSRCTH